jgi:hypothetical protein
MALAMAVTSPAVGQSCPVPVDLATLHEVQTYGLETQVTTDGRGTWIAAWTSCEDSGWPLHWVCYGNAAVLYSFSTDTGLNWTGPATISSSLSSVRRAPQVTTDGLGTWLATWSSSDEQGANSGSDHDIFIARSEDDGMTWSAPECLNDCSVNAGLDEHPRLSTDGNGNWIALWASKDTLGGTVGSDEDIFFSRSTDNGFTWSEDAALNTDADSDSDLDDYEPQITTDGAGTWVAVWLVYDHATGARRDLLSSRSLDNGETWSTPDVLNAGVASQGRPRLTTDGLGTWIAAWATYDDPVSGDYDVFYSRSTNGGLTWSDSARLNAHGDYDGDIDWDPQITTDSQGNWLAVWSSYYNLGGWIRHYGANILYAHSVDNGQTWTAALPLNNDVILPPTELHGTYRAPQLATDQQGSWVAVWTADMGYWWRTNPMVARLEPNDADCNITGTEDGCDILDGTSSDCNLNSIPDECDIDEGASDDCNANGVPDECDLATGESEDCNATDVPDECEVPPIDPSGPDCNTNGIPDECDADCQPNGVPDDCDIAGGGDDCQPNGIPDECEADCQPNDVPDDCDISFGVSDDCQENGVPDECEWVDCQPNDVHDDCDISSGMSDDCQENGVPDECEMVDCQPNGILDFCDIADGFSNDCQPNGIPDECEVDCQPNGVPDYCDMADGSSEDCQLNHVPDECDIASGTSADENGDGIPDECIVVTFAPPGLPMDPMHHVHKHRYLSINPNTNPATETALKVEVAQMRRCQNAPTRACIIDSDCDDVCDDSAGAPPHYMLKCPPADCSLTDPPSTCVWSGPCIDLAPTFDPPLAWLVQEPQQQADGEWTATLSATVYSEDWSASSLLHIGDCSIVPGVTYHVYACEPGNLGTCSEPLEVATQRFPELARPVAFPLYGDVCGGTEGGPPEVLPPDQYVNVKDLLVTQLTLINYGSASLPQAHPTWVDLQGPGVGIPPQYILNVADLTAVYVFGLTNTLPWVNTQGGLDPQDCP